MHSKEIKFGGRNIEYRTTNDGFWSKQAKSETFAYQEKMKNKKQRQNLSLNFLKNPWWNSKNIIFAQDKNKKLVKNVLRWTLIFT